MTINKLHYLYFLFLLNMCTKLFSQETKGYVKYHHEVQPSLFSKETILQNTYLDFNAEESRYLVGRTGMDNLENMGEYRHNQDKMVIATPTHTEEGLVIYRNFTNKVLESNWEGVNPLPSHKIIDNWLEMKWKLTDESKKVAGYNTKKATTNFRGTEFEVWFTEEIPLPYGPLKLFGLPGIILEITYNENKTITAYEVCYPCETIYPIEPPKAIVSKTIQEHVHFKDNFQYYLFSAMNNNHESKIYMKKIPTEKEITEKRNEGYEKIYEWEDNKTKRLLKASVLRELVLPKKTNPSEPIHAKDMKLESINYISQ